MTAISDEEELSCIGERLELRKKIYSGNYSASEALRYGAGKVKHSMLNTADSDIAVLESLVNFSREKIEETAKRLIHETDDPEKLEKIVLYLSSQGNHGLELAQDVLKSYLNSVTTKKVTDKYRRAVMLAVKFGDLETYNKHQKQFWEGIDTYSIYTNQSGKNILHYACQSENPELVKSIADRFREVHNITNPFAVKDIPEKKSLHRLSHVKTMAYYNYVRPQHYISHNLAAQLDQLYSLDGSKNGSFTSMTNYYTKIRKVVDQSIFGYLGAKAGKDENASRGAIYSAKYVGGIGVVKYNDSITAAHGMMAANIAASAFIGSAVLLNSTVVFGTNFLIRKVRSKQLGYSPDLELDANKQKDGPVTKKIKYTGRNKHDLKTALTYRDFAQVGKIIDAEKATPSIVTTDKLLSRIQKTYYFPNQNLKQEFFQMLAISSKPKELEKLILDLSVRSKEDKELSIKILKEIAAKKDTAQDTIERVALLAAELGNTKLLESAITKLPKPFKLLNIKGERGSNLMHYACRNGGNATMISFLEKKLTPEFETLSPEKITDRAFGKKLAKAKTIFDLSNSRGEKPKDFISRTTANELDVMNGVDPETGYGFSRFVNSRKLGKMRQESSFLGGAAGGVALLTGMVCVIVPPAIQLGWKAASALHAGPAGLLVATAVETACTVAICELTERVFIPLLGKSLHALSNELDKLCNGPSPTIDAFSKAAALKSIEISDSISAALGKEPKPRDISEISARIADEMKDSSPEVKRAVAKEIEKIVSKSFSQEPFSKEESFEKKLVLLENAFRNYGQCKLEHKDRGKSTEHTLPTLSHLEKLATSGIVHAISAPEATKAGKMALKKEQKSR